MALHPYQGVSAVGMKSSLEGLRSCCSMNMIVEPLFDHRGAVMEAEDIRKRIGVALGLLEDPFLCRDPATVRIASAMQQVRSRIMLSAFSSSSLAKEREMAGSAGLHHLVSFFLPGFLSQRTMSTALITSSRASACLPDPDAQALQDVVRASAHFLSSGMGSRTARKPSLSITA